MLEQSAGQTFFLKSPKNKCKFRYIYLRVTVDGASRETSTKRKWDINLWNQKTERATGSKEDSNLVFSINIMAEYFYNCPICVPSLPA